MPEKKRASPGTVIISPSAVPTTIQAVSALLMVPACAKAGVAKPAADTAQATPNRRRPRGQLVPIGAADGAARREIALMIVPRQKLEVRICRGVAAARCARSAAVLQRVAVGLAGADAQRVID